MAEKTFEYKFADESQRDRIQIEYGNSDDEILRFGAMEEGQFYVTANRSGFMALAKLCIKLAMGSYKNGFHLHVGKDFGDSNASPNLIVSLLEETT